MDNDLKEIIDSFVSEGYDRLEDAEAKMPFLESEDREIFNVIFRLFHSIKGSAGYLNFENIKHVTHEAETLLDIFRKSDLKPSQQEVDLLYQTMDFLRQLISAVEKTYTDSGYEEPAELMVNSIQQSIQNLQQDNAGKSSSNVDELVEALLSKKNNPAVEESKTDNQQNPESIAGAEGKMLKQHPALSEELPPAEDNSLDQLITPDMADKSASEANDILDQSEKLVLSLEKDPQNMELIQELFRIIHTLKGNSGFFGFNDTENESMQLENLMDSLRKGNSLVNMNTVNVLLKSLDSIRKTVIGHTRPSVPESAAAEKPLGAYKPIGEILVDIGATTQEEVEKALEAQDKPIGEILVESGKVKQEVIDQALNIQKNLAPNTASSETAVQRKEIRVDTVKLDKLFNLVGELITAESIVINNPDIAGMKLENFQKSANALTKISREIQEITMMIRMISLEGLFNKMTRLVRDLSRKFDKRVELHISGEETEMDRNVIEQISDPLVHIIRNAIDHGMEDKDKRKECGKGDLCNIYLNAKYEGNETWISIKDDGKGLDREKILKKAKERGLISGGGEELADEEVWKFIFEPGFSTADKVSEISGRGVGMDVVNKNIEKLRGKVSIHSAAGKGTEFVLKIPLTMAIIEGITVRVGSDMFSIPTTDILEFFKAKPEQITKTAYQNEVINLRGEIIPAIKLHQLFKIKTKVTELTEGVIILLQSNGKKAALLIDEIFGNQQIVIKSISNYLGTIKGISGCTIQGNGDVSFIIDSSSLISQALE